MMENTISVSVLIVDDNPAKLLSLEAALTGLNIIIVTATSGTEALRKLLGQDFAVILLDVNMPVLDGFETASIIRSRPRSENLPIIFITAERLSDDAQLKGYELGAVDYILSPVLPQILRAKVSVFVDLFRLHEQALELAERIVAKQAIIAQQNQALIDVNLSLQITNDTLEQRVAEELARSREKDILLIHQSRLALMGEMIGNIAHQWRQPLSALAMVLGNIKDASQYNELTPEYLGQKITDGLGLIDRMSSTINDFRDFFRPDKKREPFCLSIPVMAALMLNEASFKAHDIEVKIEIVEEVWTQGVVNEYSQVLLNLLSNAKDALLVRAAGPGLINVRIDRDGNQARLTITDNGGGIAKKVLPHVFEPYYSTKPNGTGIGLYMSKMIIENSMGGHITAENVESGAEITLLTPLTEKQPS
jgi:signal transduction histidine kinase